MTENVFKAMFEHDRQEQEAYADARGYTVSDSENGNLHAVCKQGESLPLANCTSRWEAVRIAYALAKAFPPSEAA